MTSLGEEGRVAAMVVQGVSADIWFIYDSKMP
jgi:hypothetical protein